MDPRTYYVEIDGQQYGPADVETLKTWVAEKRVTSETALIASDTQERIAAKEIAGLFPEPAPVAPPPPSAPPIATPPQLGYVPPADQKKTSWIPLVIAGACVVFCCPVFAAILFPVFSQAKLAAKKTSTMSQLKQISLNVLIYAGDFDDRLPPHMESVEDTRPYIEPYLQPRKANQPDLFVSQHGAESEFLGDERLGGINLQNLAQPKEVMMFYDSLIWRDRYVISYVDGQVLSVPGKDPRVALMKPIDFLEPDPPRLLLKRNSSPYATEPSRTEAHQSSN